MTGSKSSTRKAHFFTLFQVGLLLTFLESLEGIVIEVKPTAGGYHGKLKNLSKLNHTIE